MALGIGNLTNSENRFVARSARLAQPYLGPPYDRVMRRYRSTVFRARYGFPAPPYWSEWSGYDKLLDALRPRLDVPGDVLEIGVFLGGGTYKLSNFLRVHAPHKRAFALDIFDPDFDATASVEGAQMNALYQEALAGRSQREVFDAITAGCTNLTTIVGDSAAVEIPDVALCLAFIDGNHDRAYVRSDFDLVWSRLSPGGVVALHDYGDDLPEVTDEIHHLIGEHAGEISRLWVDGSTFFIERSRSGPGGAVGAPGAGETARLSTAR